MTNDHHIEIEPVVIINELIRIKTTKTNKNAVNKTSTFVKMKRQTKKKRLMESDGDGYKFKST